MKYIVSSSCPDVYLLGRVRQWPFQVFGELVCQPFEWEDSPTARIWCVRLGLDQGWPDSSLTATADLIEQAQFGLDVKAKVMPLYEKVFDVEYPLPKLDTLVVRSIQSYPCLGDLLT